MCCTPDIPIVGVTISRVSYLSNENMPELSSHFFSSTFVCNVKRAHGLHAVCDFGARRHAVQWRAFSLRHLLPLGLPLELSESAPANHRPGLGTRPTGKGKKSREKQREKKRENYWSPLLHCSLLNFDFFPFVQKE